MMPAATPTTQSNPFIKQFASSDRKTRARALSSLRTYLHRTTPFTPLEFLKLWKALYFSMWMCDKPLPQQRLARELADLLDVVQGSENFLGFLGAFWKTMAREWNGIDALRMDKFLFLVRCVLGKALEVVGRGGWRDDGGLVEGFLGSLEETPLNSRDARIPNGLRFHVVDIFVDELDKVDGERRAPMQRLLVPIRKLGRETVTKAVRVRVQEALEDERVADWQGGEVEEGDAIAGGIARNEQPEELAAPQDIPDEEDEFEGFGA